MDYREIDSLDVGSIISTKSGVLRVVRNVTRFGPKKMYKSPPEGSVKLVAVTINRCSWTKRPYTFIGRATLKKHYDLVSGVHVKQESLESNQFQHEFMGELKSGRPPIMKCCDVKQIP